MPRPIIANKAQGRTLCLLMILLLSCSAIAWSQERPPADTGEPEKSYKVPHRYGMALSLGHSYGLGRNQNYGMALVTLIGLFDYDRVWPHRAPDPLRFKVEFTAGSTTWPEAPRAVVSANILALYYLDALRGEWARPYVEGGIGAIYTDFQVKHQGSRVNFNPVAGIGVEFPGNDSGLSFFTALRLHHLSNAGILPDNQGLNSAFLMFGVYF